MGREEEGREGWNLTADYDIFGDAETRPEWNWRRSISAVRSADSTRVPSVPNWFIVSQHEFLALLAASCLCWSWNRRLRLGKKALIGSVGGKSSCRGRSPLCGCTPKSVVQSAVWESLFFRRHSALVLKSALVRASGSFWEAGQALMSTWCGSRLVLVNWKMKWIKITNYRESNVMD